VWITWLRRPIDLLRYQSPVGLAAVLTGIAAGLGVIWGSGDITRETLERGMVVGVLAGVPLWMIERNWRRRFEEGRADPKPDGSTAADALPGPPAAAEAPPVAAGPGTTFRGRTRELATLLENYRAQRAIRAAGGVAAEAAGAVVLMVHGMPGVGKSALAEQLRRELESEFTSRPIYANLGRAGARRPPADILRAFLDELGRPEPDPAATVRQLADEFRSVTVDKQLLFIFDAARDHHQVRAIMPTGPGCTVIVTSRRDLSPALNEPASLLLEVPDADGALDILSAWSGVAVESDPEAATELVELCGRIPYAIVGAAERIAVHGTDLRHVADALRPARTRLEMLEHIGRNVRQRFESEMDQLTPELRQALCLLMLVPADTFLARVLTSLLKVREQAAEDLMAGLAEAQLVVNAGIDEAVGMPRYTVNPIVRLVCEAELARMDADLVRAARRRYVDAYMLIVAEIVRRTDGTSGLAGDHVPPPWSWAATGHGGRYSDHVEYAVELEYHSLVRAATEAHAAGHWGLCWRIACRLRGGAADGVASALPVYRLAIDAAQQEGDQFGEIAVWLAKAASLTTVEVYAEAFKCIANANALAGVIIAKNPDAAMVRNARVAQARVYGMLAETYAHMASFARAAQFTYYAADLADRYAIEDEDEKVHVTLLRAEIHRVTMPLAVNGGPVRAHVGDRIEYREALIKSEDGRRRGDWQTAETCLAEALALSEHDASHRAIAQYRLARLALDQHAAGDPSHARIAIRRAAQAAVGFGRTNNVIGQLRAQCTLVRAQAAAGNITEAEHLFQMVTAKLAFMRHLAGPAFLPLVARLAHAEADLLTAQNRPDRARSSYLVAASIYAAEHDWSARRAVMVRLRQAGPSAPRGAPPTLVQQYLRDLTGDRAYRSPPTHGATSEAGLPGSGEDAPPVPASPVRPRLDRAGATRSARVRSGVRVPGQVPSGPPPDRPG
jgi:hypothetical protein